MHRLGFGAMHLPVDSARDQAIAVARRAVELGVTLIDTAHLYGGGANEELLASALYPYPDELVITTKVAGGTRCGRAAVVEVRSGVVNHRVVGDWGHGRPESRPQDHQRAAPPGR